MNNHEAHLDPQRTALLVLDYQGGVLGGLEGQDVPTLLERVAATLDTARTAGAHVIYVRVGYTDADHAAVPSANKVFAPLAAARALHESSPEAAIHERLAPRAGDVVVRKTRLGAFSSSDLQQRLQELGVDNLILAGTHSRGVLLATVVEAVDRDYPVWVVADASADPNPQVHQMLVDHVFSFQAHVVNVAELPALLTRS